MPYVTVHAPIKYPQLTIEELLEGTQRGRLAPWGKVSDTRTYYVREVTPKLLGYVNIPYYTRLLSEFAEKYAELREQDRNSLYRTFKIPKNSGGMRTINAPNQELSTAIRELKDIFENKIGLLYHTAAFAYVKGRCAVDAVKRHQSNQSRWFLKTDFSDFFGSCSKAFVLHQMTQIFPISEIMKTEEGNRIVSDAMDLCFLNGGLPQGTQISPMLTNIIMIPIDHYLYNSLRDHNGQKFTYTRYADDMTISSRENFNFQDMVSYVNEICEKFNAPLHIKPQKTHYGSSAGRNWCLGVMLNKDNQISIGFRRKQAFRSQLYAYLKDKQNGINWPLEDVQQMNGIMSYFRMVEKDYIDYVISHYGEKFKCNVLRVIRTDLKKL